VSEPLDGWSPGSFAHGDITRPTFRRGVGPGVVVIHELPGITPTVIRFADDVVEAGFTVVMPSLVGTPGRPMRPWNTLASTVRVCIAGEFTTWATGQTSPIAGWLRALARSLHGELGGPGVGAVGMCFSGGFALAMTVEPAVVAPVASQPSLPFAVGAARRADLGLSDDDVVALGGRAADGCDVLGLRFCNDWLVGSRFETLGDLLGPAFLPVELPSRRRSDHSVLTEQRDDDAVRRVVTFLEERLRP